ncbi:CD5 antigen-like [Boleophthalmus pectinirostris]|uniref:CD5 antigen-like n=1 Tax=Boleophthalmus pectinirostris TaxID=150288 RepID=UPI00242B2786|nr:CD5 antigen-like [Boleophthalmus pectinirostris]
MGLWSLKHRGEWRRVEPNGFWDQDHTSVVCRDLDCGSAVYGEQRDDFPQSRVWRVSSDCVKESSVRECVFDSSSSPLPLPLGGLEVKCSESVRLVSGSGLCSGSVQIWDGSWTGVCDGDLDQRGAEVLCRELGCGAPSLLQGALSPLGQTFHCEGHESALMDCPRSNSSTCSSGTTVHLTCSEPLRLVGGVSRCAGTVELKHRGEWGRVVPNGLWNQDHTSGVCRDLDCGSAVYGKQRDGFPQTRVWGVTPDCVKTSSLRECVYDSPSFSRALEVKCSESVRLARGPVCVQDQCRSGTGPGPGSVTGLGPAGGRGAVQGAGTVGLLLSSRGRSLLWGRRSTVRAMSLLLMDCPPPTQAPALLWNHCQSHLLR